MPEPLSMLDAGLNIEHHILPTLYVSFIYNQSGSLLRWFRDTFASADKRLVEEDDDIYDLLAREMPDGPTRLLVLPHFEMTGTPGLIADSAGVIAGLKIATTRGEIFKAIMEGTTFYFVDSINNLRGMGIDTSEFIATGGGAKSDAWLQIKADIFGVPFVRPSFTECGVLGAAILAGVSTGALSSPHDGVSRFVRRQHVFEPDAQRHKAYRDLYGKYCGLYPSVQHLQAKL
jgi:xylulokinase